MTATSFRRTAAALCLISGVALSGCSFAPEYSRPEMDLPENWSKAPYELAQASHSLEIQWWKRFNDPVLDKLVEEALLHNQNLAVAVARVDQARAYLGLSKAGYLPTVGASGQAGRSHVTDGQLATGEALTNLANTMALLHGMPATNAAPGHMGNSFSTGIQAAWELDLWGKVRNSTEIQ